MAQGGSSANYERLLTAGVSPSQIRAAINNGLNPSQLPPEYFGLSGGYTPTPVSPTPSASPIGGIDIPPANMADPYAYNFGPNPTANVGGNMQFEHGLPDWGWYPPSGGYAAPGYTGGPNIGGQMNLGGYGPQMPSGFSMDWGYLPSSQQYGWTMPDYSSMNSGGPMTFGGYGGDSGGFDLYGAPIDWGYLPSSQQYGWTAPDYSNSSVSMGQDTSRSPADVFAGLQDPVPEFSEPDSLDPFAGAVAGGDPGTPVNPFAGAVAGGDAGTPTVTPNGTNLPATNYNPNGTTVGLPVGYAPPSGTFQMGTYIPGGMPIGYNFGQIGTHYVGVPGTTVSGTGNYDPMTGTYGYSTAVGMFGLGAMNAPGGSMPVGIGGPESGIDLRTAGEGERATKHGMLMDDLSGPFGPSKWELHAEADPASYWSKRIMWDKAAISHGSQLGGPMVSTPYEAALMRGTLRPAPTTTTAKPKG